MILFVNVAANRRAGAGKVKKVAAKKIVIIQRVKELEDAFQGVNTILKRCADRQIANHTALRKIDTAVNKALANTQGGSK